MPKKKLTKTQIKKKVERCHALWYDLVLDKWGHPDSKMGMSKARMMKVLDEIGSSLKWIK